MSDGPCVTCSLATPQAEAVGEAAKAYPTCDCFLLDNHGVIVVGSSVEEAFSRFELLVRLAERMRPCPGRTLAASTSPAVIDGRCVHLPPIREGRSVAKWGRSPTGADRLVAVGT